VQQLASGLGLQQQQQTRIVQQLVGVAEVSFKESTRSAYLTLNPPRVRLTVVWPTFCSVRCCNDLQPSLTSETGQGE
jgi:hypothetical protein